MNNALRQWTLLLLIPFFVSACETTSEQAEGPDEFHPMSGEELGGGTDSKPPVALFGEERRTNQPLALPEIALPDLVPAWGTSGRVTGMQRRALIVSVDQYGEDELAFSEAKIAGTEMVATLTSLGFGEDEISVLSGNRTTPDTIKSELQTLTRDLRGQGNVLLVYWVGHSYTADGERQLLTRHSVLDQTARVFDKTLPVSRLYENLREVRHAVGSRGGQIEVGLVVEACPVPVEGIPTGIFRMLKPVADVEAFSASGSRAALYLEGEAPVFTQNLCDALANSGTDRVSLLGALRSAVARTNEDSAQNPLISTGDRDLILVDPANISISVQPIDVISGNPLPSAEVTLDGRAGMHDSTLGAVTFDGLVGDRSYELGVECDGYWPATLTEQVGAARNGQTLRVPVAPRFVAVEGQVLAGPGEHVSVEATGEFGGKVIRNYHALIYEFTGSGSYRLKLPVVSGELSLLIKINGEIVERRPLALGDSRAEAATPQRIVQEPYLSASASSLVPAEL